MNIDTRPPPYSLRIDPEVRAKLEAIAKAHNRSLHAEIMTRLIYTLENPDLLNANVRLTSAQELHVRELIREELDLRLSKENVCEK